MGNQSDVRTSKSGAAVPTMNRILEEDIKRLEMLREDVLLLRFHLARRTDITQVIDETDRLQAESALKSSLAVLSAYESHQPLPAAHVSAASSALMYAVDRLVHGARLADIEDATGEPPPPVTPESLRASLPPSDISHALGHSEADQQSTTRSRASRFVIRQIWCALLAFAIALIIQVQINHQPQGAASPSSTNNAEETSNGADTARETTDDLVLRVDIPILKTVGLKNTRIPKDILIPISAFFWAIVGAMVWILIRFRRFGSAYAFNPAQARVYWARVVSGAVTTSILLYFVFGGKEPWAENWTIDLPLWAFVLGYAGRLQVELLRRMVERIEQALREIIPLNKSRSTNAGQTPPTAPRGTSSENRMPPALGTLKKPEPGQGSGGVPGNHS
ncbi:MAG: hypothetical protein PVG49_00940 [Desulfobacteraceae bacterium]|jgi:hypothetical protein